VLSKLQLSTASSGTKATRPTCASACALLLAHACRPLFGKIVSLETAQAHVM
jgi:hypothetical protein